MLSILSINIDIAVTDVKTNIEEKNYGGDSSILYIYHVLYSSATNETISVSVTVIL